MPKVSKCKRKMKSSYASPKRRMHDNSENSFSESEICSFQKPAFPIDLDDSDFDLTIPPTSGIEYLRRVHYEAKQCPPVVVANMDTSIFKEKQTVKFNTCSGCIPAPSGFKPTLKWQEMQVQYFYDIRQKLSAYKEALVYHSETLKPPIKLPSSNDNIAWCKLCFGVKAFNAIQKPLKPVKDAISSEGNGSVAPEENEGIPPLLSIICSLSQPAIEKILNCHINWMEVMGFTNQQGRWFYALLASLETPLTPEICSSLRTLARNCSALRATLSRDDDPRLIPLNLLICLVARFFRQSDLADSP